MTIKSESKTKNRYKMNDFFKPLGSSNFLTSLLTLFLSGFAMAGAVIPADAGAAVVEAAFSGNYWKLMFAVTVNLINPLWHFFKSKPEKWWSSFGSVNFWTNATSLVLSLFLLHGIDIPDDTAPALVAAIHAKNWMMLGSIVAVNLINPIIHFFRPSKSPANPSDFGPTIDGRAGSISAFSSFG